MTLRAALVALLMAAPAAAQPANAVPEDGLFVTVPNPITSEAYQRIKNRIDAAVNRPGGSVKKVILDFNGGKDAASPDYGACFDLATHIARQHSLGTVAYISHAVAGHTVLPVLACKEVVAARGASLGEIVKPGEEFRPSMRSGYEEILGTARSGYFAVVRKMTDRSLPLGVGQKNGGKVYVDLRELAKLKADGVTVPDTTPLPNLGAGSPGVIPAETLRNMGLAAALVESRKDVAELYGLSPASLRDDPLAGRAPVGFHLALRGPVDGGTREAVVRMAGDVVRKGGNVLFLELECSGGDLSAASDLAGKLIELQKGENAILVVGFVPRAAPDTAAVIALGCGEIVMSRGKGAEENGESAEATIGDFEAALGRKEGGNADLWKPRLREIATEQGYPQLLVDGMVDRDLAIVLAQKANEPAKKRLMTAAELDAEKPNWTFVRSVKGKGELLKLRASDALQLGLARHVVDRPDVTEVYAIYGVSPSSVREATPGWLDRFADYLRKPTVTVLLVVIGFAGLILELKVPGTTVPGIIAALCFILVFWAHSQFNGQAAVLGGLLFALGLVLILIEVFVLPGFGVSGVLGLALMLGGVGLATLDRIPESPAEWTEFGVKVMTYVAALAGGVVLAFVIARFLPKIPYANKMMLQPPGEREPEAGPDLPGAALAAALLGAVGTAQTSLRPAGMAQFGDQYVDVVTEGGFIPAAARVQVVEVEGTRIVVKEV